MPQAAREHRRSSAQRSRRVDDDDDDDDFWEGSWADFEHFAEEMWHEDDAGMPSWEDLWREDSARDLERENACLRRLFFGLLDAFAVLLTLWGLCGDVPLFFPAPFHLSNRRFGSAVSLHTDFKTFTAQMVTERHGPYRLLPQLPWHRLPFTRAGNQLVKRAEEMFGRAFTLYRPFLLITYNSSDAYAAPAPGHLAGTHAPPPGALLLGSPRLVGAKVFTIYTLLQPASRANKPPATWPPSGVRIKGSGGTTHEACVRLLRSGTVTHKPWFRDLEAALDALAEPGAQRPRWDGPKGRLRPFGLVAVHNSECSRDLGTVTIVACALAGLLGGCFTVACGRRRTQRAARS